VLYLAALLLWLLVQVFGTAVMRCLHKELGSKIFLNSIVALAAGGLL